MLRTAHVVAVALVATCAVAPPIAGAAPLTGNGRIAFVDMSTRSPSIGVINPNGTGRRQLTATRPLMGQPAWRPGGNRIAFVLADRIAFINADGSGIRWIGNGDRSELAPRWSPSGGELAFIRARTADTDDGWDLIVARGDGSHQRVVTIPAGVKHPEGFAWSKDGRRVTWMASRSGGSPNTLVSVDVTTGATSETRLKRSCITPPAQAPSGPLSVCLVDPWGPEIVLLRADKLVRSLGFVNESTGEAPPVWNPQGTQVAYGVDFNRVAVYTFATRRARTYSVPTRDMGTESTVSWSPDGRQLVVGANRAEGWSIEVLTLRTRLVTIIALHSEDNAPRFSPDGTRLAYVHTPWLSPPELRVIDGLQRPSRIIARGIQVAAYHENDQPAFFGWSPDSRSIAYTTRAGALVVADVVTGKVRTVSRSALGQPFWSPDGSTIAYATDTRTIAFLHADGSGGAPPKIEGESAVLGWTPDSLNLFVTAPPPALPAVVAVASGVTVSTFATPAEIGSTLSPDATSVLLATSGRIDHEHNGFSITVEYHGVTPAGASPISQAPAVWSPSGSSILFSLGYSLPGSGYYDPWAPRSFAIAPAGDLGALGTPIPDATLPTWQPVPAR
jgi:TolB protein